MQRTWSSEAGLTLQTAQRGFVPGEARTGGAQRPPEGRLRSVQVSRTILTLTVAMASQQEGSCEGVLSLK